MCRVQVIGCGYVGLTTALAFSNKGFPVTGIEIDNGKREAIRSGQVPFHEPGISELLEACLRNGFDVKDSPVDSDISFITVGTPSKEDGSINLEYVEYASKMLGNFLKDHRNYHTVVMKSTVTPGTTDSVAKPAIESASGKKIGKDIGLCMNPEFLREGSALKDMLEADRVVIGEYDKNSGDVLASLYRSFYKDKMPPLIRTNLVNAEFIKYASNAFLATKISFMNTVANIAQRIPSADVSVIAKGMGFDKRIGTKFLNAGLGYGGSCFPKDVRAFIALAKSVGYNPMLLEDVDDVNNRQFETTIDLARSVIGGFDGKTITLLGLSFKPDSDDIREAVSDRIIGRLLGEGARIQAYDPVASEGISKKYPTGNSISYTNSAIEALRNSDCCFLVTEWDEFRKLTPEDFLRNMTTAVLIDGRRIYDPHIFTQKMKSFFAIGLGSAEFPRYYNNARRDPALAVNAIIPDSTGRVLLVRRNNFPFKGALSLPGGFVEYGESVEQALSRELREELGVELISSKLVSAYSDPARSPEKHVVVLLYQVKFNGRPNLIDRNELSEGVFCDPRKLPERLAFDHSRMLEDYLNMKDS